MIKRIVILTLFLLLAQTAMAQEPVNLLENGDFTETSSGGIAAGWTPFAISDEHAPPHYHLATVDGRQVQQWSGDGLAGVYQQVTVEAGTAVRLEATTRAWSTSGESPGVSQEPAWVRQRVGLDPLGGTDPLASTVMWSAPGQLLDTWGTLAVETYAEAATVTVFLSAYPNAPRRHNDIYFDAARLFVVAHPLPVLAAPLSVDAPSACDEPLLDGLVTGCGTAPGQQGYVAIAQPTAVHDAVIVFLLIGLLVVGRQARRLLR